MSLDILLEENPESYYWMGFLLADGYCDFKRKRICVTLGELDELHLLVLKKYLNIDNDINRIEIQKSFRLNFPSNLDVVNRILNKFGWNQKKTYNPPNLEIFESIGLLNTLFWFIGFIDGDGCVQHQPKRKDVKISIHIHSSWIDVMLYIHSFVDQYFNCKTASPRLLKSGFLRYDISDTRLVQNLKKFVIENKLPVLKRKWDKIDLNRQHRFDVAKQKQQKIFELREKGFTRQQISKELLINLNTLNYYIYLK